MKPDVKIEIIYYGAAADWSFESGFYSKEYALRLLTQTAANPSAFLKALDRPVQPAFPGPGDGLSPRRRAADRGGGL